MEPAAIYDAFHARLEKKKDLKLPDWVDKLPKLKVKKGAPAVTSAVVGQILRREVEKGTDLGGRDALRAVADPESLDKLARALARSWYARRSPSSEKWQVIGAGHLGGVRTAWFLMDKVFKDLDKVDGHHRCNAAIEALLALAVSGEPNARKVAVTALDLLNTQPTRYIARRGNADAALVTLGGAIDRGAPPARRLRLGRSQPEIRAALVTRDLPEVIEPKAEPLVKALLERRFERWMIDGVRIDGFDFEDKLAEHPVAGGLVKLLVWGVFDADAVVPFRVDAGELVDARGARVDLDPEARVGVVHPLELDEAQREEWQALAREYELAAPFPQMGRKTFALRGDEPASLELTRYQWLSYSRLVDPLTEAGFEADQLGDMGGTESFVTRYARGDQLVTVFIGYDGGDSRRIGHERTVAGSCDYSGQPRGDAVAWGEVDPVVVSEVLYALDRAGGGAKSRGKTAAGVAPKGGGRPQTGRFPYAERAKSGRSKCVVCGEKIEKDSVRVAVERELDMGSFTRPGAAFLHDTCTDGAPELQGVDVDAVLSENSPGVWPPS